MAHGVEIPLPGDNGLADTLAQLPARYRQVLLLRFAYGYTTRELAKEFGMTQSAVQKLIWRAKETLKNHLSEGGGNDENK
jgi:RNA polymerase sigma-70 factor (ECF subfamily)